MRWLALVVLVCGCARVSPPGGYGVDLIVVAAGVTDRGQIAQARLTVSGSESYRKDVEGRSLTTGDLRLQYVPGVAAGLLEFRIDALAGDGMVLASGDSGSVTLVPGHGVVAEVTLGRVPDDLAIADDFASESSNDLSMAAGPDLAAPRDLATTDDLSAGRDMMLRPDMTTPHDLATTPHDLAVGPDLAQPPPCGTGTEVIAAATTQYIAVGATDIFYADSGAIKKVSKSGGTPVTLTSSAGSNPWQMVTDGTNVYWTVFASTTGDGGVYKVPVGGGARASLATGQNDPMGIAVDTNNVYWTTYDGKAWSVPIGGGTPVTIGSGSGSEAAYMAVDSTNAYWTDWSGYQLYSTPRGGGSSLLLYGGSVADSPNPNGVVATGGFVYWASQTGPINKIPTGGGTKQTLATGTSPIMLVTDGANLYWGNYQIVGSIGKVGVGGGGQTTVATGTNSPYGLGIDGTFVYWAARSMAICKAAK